MFEWVVIFSHSYSHDSRHDMAQLAHFSSQIWRCKHCRFVVDSRVQRKKLYMYTITSARAHSKWEIYEFLIFAFTYLRLDTFILRAHRLRPLTHNTLTYVHIFWIQLQKTDSQNNLPLLYVCFKSDLCRVDDWNVPLGMHSTCWQANWDLNSASSSSSFQPGVRGTISIRKMGRVSVCNLHAMGNWIIKRETRERERSQEELKVGCDWISAAVDDCRTGETRERKCFHIGKVTKNPFGLAQQVAIIFHAARSFSHTPTFFYSPVKDKQEISLVERCQNQQLIYWIIDTIVIVVFFSTLSFLPRRDAAVKIFVLTTKEGSKKLSKLRVNVNLLWWVEEDGYDDGRHCRLIDERDILSILMRKSSEEWENL